jgi:hypothetical protein
MEIFFRILESYPNEQHLRFFNNSLRLLFILSKTDPLLSPEGARNQCHILKDLRPTSKFSSVL